jgi:type II restriction/modification system DNA methylase subunit YeeA
MNPTEFARKWSGSNATERAASQEHFIDLCRMLEVRTPNEADPTGEWYAFEKGLDKIDGGGGFADVWRRGFFGWEYKGKRKDLGAAYQQLLQYREALENPPLLVVCDLNRFEVHTNFTNTAKTVYTFTLDDLEKNPREPLRILRAVMTEPFALRPTETRSELTEKAARRFAELAGSLSARGHDPQRSAHFLNKLLFCLFAEDSGLLPRDLIERIVVGMNHDPPGCDAAFAELFTKMASQGGVFGAERIQWFNGGLFDSGDTIELTRDELKVVEAAARLDWSQVEPAIFGTLFERGLDPGKRTQLGAHYTDRVAIERVIEPLVMEPLRLELEAIQAAVAEEGTMIRTQLTQKGAIRRNTSPLYARYRTFIDRVRALRVLDPACGSGNFLYVTLQALKDLEKEATQWASAAFGVPIEFPEISPTSVLGLELSPYAAELARVVIWIGEIQWMINNGYSYRRDPILQPLYNIECRDSLVDESAEVPVRTEWQKADVIVGNPPFLGGKLLRANLVDRLSNGHTTAQLGQDAVD